VLKTIPKKGRDMRGLRRFWYVMLGEYATSRVCYPLHRVIYRLSGGRITFSMIGPVILLTTTGRKSGKPRTAPLLGFQEGQSIIVIPSNAGKKHYPSWYLNLRADPQAQVQVGRELRQVRAREATPQEQERLWPYITSQYGGYDAYRERTDRHIPVVILDRV
jgi:deazaflavin-dependent oxidoreductase (nitroreductase family)